MTKADERQAQLGRVLAAVAAAFGVPVIGILHGTNRRACDARGVVTDYCRSVLKWKWEVDLAPMLGYHHATLIHHRNKVRDIVEIGVDLDFIQRYNNAMKALEQLTEEASERNSIRDERAAA